MALVGNFGFGNGDRTAETTGVGAIGGGNAFARRGSRPQDDPVSEQHARERTGSFAWSATRGSVQSNRPPSSPDQKRQQANYFSNGITPQNEKEGLEKFESPDTKAESDEDAQARADATITELAKTLTRQSTYTNVPDSPFGADADSPLDPNSKNFRPRTWVKSMIKLNETENRTPGRTAGIAFRDLNVHGYGAATDYQKDVGNIWFEVVGMVKKAFGLAKPRRIDILRNFEGIVHSGEMLVVLGPPGSGCSTFLKTITGETHGFVVDEGSYLNYQGIPPEKMHKYFRGEAIYTAEVDVHFPMMTVADTLSFAARARAPKNIPGGVSKQEWADHLRDVFMATFGISHTKNTKVGNDYVRGVSGGERKRVTIAEAALSGAPLQCWDNSTRGLDSANAIEFTKTVRLSTELLGAAACVAIYQAPQAAYDVFDKALVLYEGRQIFFGPTTEAKAYFVRMGFRCPDRATTADFLTSMTSPQERFVRDGFKDKVPRTPDEFAAVWKASPERAALTKELDSYDKTFPYEGEHYNRFVESRQAQQSKHQRIKSPYTLSYSQQVNLCLWRGFQRLKADPTLTFTQLFGNFAMALVLGSVFFNMPDTTGSFFTRGAVIFFAVS